MHMAGGAAASFSQRKRSSGHGASAVHVSYCCCLCCQGWQTPSVGRQDALQPECNVPIEWPAQKEPKPFLAPEPAGMTRSTLKRTVLDSGLRTQAGEQKGACMSHILVPAPRCGCRRQHTGKWHAGVKCSACFVKCIATTGSQSVDLASQAALQRQAGVTSFVWLAGPGHQSLTGTGQ